MHVPPIPMKTRSPSIAQRRVCSRMTTTVVSTIAVRSIRSTTSNPTCLPVRKALSSHAPSNCVCHQCWPDVGSVHTIMNEIDSSAEADSQLPYDGLINSQNEHNADLHSVVTPAAIQLHTYATENQLPINYGLTGLKGVSVISFSSSSSLRSAGDETVVCTDDGFMTDPNDCTVFYRCISNGRGYNKIGFRCSDGTAWDESLQSCNHISDVRATGGCSKQTGPLNDAYADQTSTQSSQSSYQNTTSSSSSSSSQQSSSTSSSMSSSSNTSHSSSSSNNQQQSSSTSNQESSTSSSNQQATTSSESSSNQNSGSNQSSNSDQNSNSSQSSGNNQSVHNNQNQSSTNQGHNQNASSNQSSSSNQSNQSSNNNQNSENHQSSNASNNQESQSGNKADPT